MSVHRRRYEERFQLDDPLTPRLMSRRTPTRATDVLPRRELQGTVSFQAFRRPDGLHWGLNTYAHDGTRHLGDLRIWRRRTRSNFDDDDLALMRAIHSALVRALGRNGFAPARQAFPEREALAEWPVQCAALSRREAEVAALACEGLADKDIARALGIGFTTVRAYLAAAFRKLGCEGRTRLVHCTARLLLQ